MTHDDKAAETRKSFSESVKGKAKEVAGAVTGNDSLTAEGQLEQKEAKERRRASATEAEVQQEAEGAKAQERSEVASAAKDYVQARDNYQESVDAAVSTEAQAARLRQRAENLDETN